MEPIRITTQRLIKNWSTQRQTEMEDVLGDGLKKFLTKQERKHITRYSLKDSRVILNLDSSAWLYLINLKKKQLLKNLNQILEPGQTITEIFLQLDRNGTKNQIKR
jgi:hypothetical protein